MNSIAVVMVLVLAGIAAALWIFIRRNLRGKPTPLELEPGDPLARIFGRGRGRPAG
ncbi:MAG: hypothetical protein U5K76_07035 [Woeseiaceae bacterium]|nr:hypothetical protein [Woeseiaceae bacterium]